MVPSKGVKRQQCDQEQYELTTFRTFKKFEIRTFFDVISSRNWSNVKLGPDVIKLFEEI